MPANFIRSKIFRVSLQPISWLLKTGNEHATIDRLFDSKHVRDIQLIIGVSCALTLFVVFVGALLAGWGLANEQWHLFDTVIKCVKYGGPVLLVFGGVTSWAYNAGSSRLGVVDLFACEITTLCRVTTVMQTVRQSVDRVNHPPMIHSSGLKTHMHGIQPFTSEENYFPIFGSNSQALQALEATVVLNRLVREICG